MYIYSSTPASVTNAQSLAATGTIMSHSVKRSMKLDMLLLAISTAVVSSGNVVVNFYQRLAIGVDTNRVLLGTLNILPGASVGQCYYKQIESVDLYPGQELIAVVSTAAAGGGAAGAGDAGYVAEESPEDPRNVSAMVLSS